MDDRCIFLNMEVNINNINSKLEHLGSIPRLYENETVRLVRSIRLIQELKHIPIYLILFKELEEYNSFIIEALNKMKVTYLFPKLSDKYKNEIKYFQSGFWFIPLTGLLMENTYNYIPGLTESYLVDIYGNIPKIERFGLKLDADMIMLRNPFDNDIFKQCELSRLYTINAYSHKPICGYYDKDFGKDCEERKKYGLYDIQPMSNTCLIYSDLKYNIYNRWYNCLINTDNGYDDLYEEVSFDIEHPFHKNIPFMNFQIGENYLDINKLSEEERKNIYFYHQKMERNYSDLFNYELVLELKKLFK